MNVITQNCGFWHIAEANAKYYGYYEEATRIVHRFDSSIHQNQDGFTPLYLTANCGHIDLVKFFSTFTKNSNSPSLNGACTPIGKDQFALNTRVS